MSGSNNKVVRVWSLNENTGLKVAPQKIWEDGLTITSFCLSRDKTRIAVGHKEGKVSIWRFEEDAGRFILDQEIQEAVNTSIVITAVQFSINSGYLLLGNGEGSIRMYGREGRENVYLIKTALQLGDSPIEFISVLEDFSKFVYASREGGLGLVAVDLYSSTLREDQKFNKSGREFSTVKVS